MDCLYMPTGTGVFAENKYPVIEILSKNTKPLLRVSSFIRHYTYFILHLFPNSRLAGIINPVLWGTLKPREVP